MKAGKPVAGIVVPAPGRAGEMVLPTRTERTQRAAFWKWLRQAERKALLSPGKWILCIGYL